MEIRYSKQCIYLSRVLSDSSNWVAIFAGRQRGRESETDVNNVVVKICIQIQTPSQLELMSYFPAHGTVKWRDTDFPKTLSLVLKTM